MMKIFELTMLTVALCVMVSCGDSATTVDAITEDNFDSWVNRFCEKLGINRDDFYDYWGANGCNNKTIVVTLRKRDDKAYIAVYDTLKNSVIFTDTYFSLVKSMEANYYEDRYTYNLSNLYPSFCENGNGFVIVINATYTSSKTTDVKFLQKIIFNDGIHNSYMEHSTNSYVTPCNWYGNSYLLYVRGGRYANCYDEQGTLLHQNMYYPNGENYLPISYTEYIDFGNNSSLNKFQIGRKNAINNKYEWITDLALVEDASDDLHVSYTCESQAGDTLTLVCKVVSRDGNIQNFHIQLNILTGEYTQI